MAFVAPLTVDKLPTVAFGSVDNLPTFRSLVPTDHFGMSRSLRSPLRRPALCAARQASGGFFCKKIQGRETQIRNPKTSPSGCPPSPSGAAPEGL